MSIFKRLSIFGIGLYSVALLIWLIKDHFLLMMLLWVSSITFTICFVVYNIYLFMHRRQRN